MERRNIVTINAHYEIYLFIQIYSEHIAYQTYVNNSTANSIYSNKQGNRNNKMF